MPHLKVKDAELYYELKGEGPPLLFMQGVGVIGAGWGPQVKELAKSFQCLSFDNRGIGQSADSAAALTIEQMAADALALMVAAGWESAHLAGHSMGGVIAQQLALEAPQRVRSLSLLCTFSKGKEAARLTPQVLKMGLRTRIGSPRMRRRAFLDMLFSQDYLATRPTDELAASLAPVIGRDLATSPPILMKQLKAMGAHDRSTDLPALSHIPTLVVSAANDPIALPAYGRRLSELIPGSRYLEIPNASHGIVLQDPARINTLLRDHILQAEKTLPVVEQQA